MPMTDRAPRASTPSPAATSSSSRRTTSATRAALGVAALLATLVTTAPAQDASADSADLSWLDDLLAETKGRAPLVAWERDLDDALALSKSTGKPLLVCVNTDGEPASDSLARGRYADPAFAELASGFVPVIASPNEHAPRGRDGRGRRIPCPRFGRVLCEEHVAMEPLVYGRWFSNQRVAPRHVGVSPDGDVLFDLYLLNDLSAIDRALREHGRFDDEALADPAAASEAALLQRVDASARAQLERRFLAGDEATRLRLVETSVASDRAAVHDELLRLGTRDVSPTVVAAAARVASGAAERLPWEVLRDAARHLADDGQALAPVVAALEAGDDAAARRLGTLLAAAHRPSPAVDVEAWVDALDSVPEGGAPVPDPDALAARADELDRELSEAPEDADLLTELARTFFDLTDPRLGGDEEGVGYLLEQARDTAARATAVEGAPARAWAILACSDWLLNGPVDAAADAAARALPGLIDTPALSLVTDTLDVLVQARSIQLLDALDAGAEPDETWLAHVVAGTRVLVEHPWANPVQVSDALNVIGGLELDGLHADLARRAVLRDPVSPEIHDHLRWHLLRDGDAANLAAAYDALAEEVDGELRPIVRWYGAFGCLAAGDRLREEQRGDDARVAYALSLAGFRADAERETPFTNSSDYVGLARAGIARVLFDSGDPTAAAEELAEAAAASRSFLDMPDALGVTPRETAREVKWALRREGADRVADNLDAAIASGE